MSENKTIVHWHTIAIDGYPKHNIGVLVFIPDEDYHITSGMWDISKNWVLLDEYRTPESAVTHWADMPEMPEGYAAEMKEIDETIYKFLKIKPHVNR